MGRKLHLTDPEWQDRIDLLIDLIRKGNYVDVACKKVGLDRKQFYDWMKRARRGDGPEFTEFARRVDEADAEFENTSLQFIIDAGKEKVDWKAITWILERKFSQRWGPPMQQSKVVKEIRDKTEEFLKKAEKTLSPEDFSRLLDALESDEVSTEEPRETESDNVH